MEVCIYDSMEECGRSCTGCKAAVIQCENCGKTGVDNLYNSSRGVFCGDCLMEETGQEFYEEFASVYKDEFRQFFLESNGDIRVSAE